MWDVGWVDGVIFCIYEGDEGDGYFELLLVEDVVCVVGFIFVIDVFVL